MNRWSLKTEISIRPLLSWASIAPSKFYDWRQRYGRVNEHNAWVPRDHCQYMAGLLQKMRFSDAKRIVAMDSKKPPDFEVIVQLKNHLVIMLRASESEEDGSLWAQIDAQVANDEQTSDFVKQEADRLNSNFSDWNVKLPRKSANRLKIRLSDIVKRP